MVLAAGTAAHEKEKDEKYQKQLTALNEEGLTGRHYGGVVKLSLGTNQDRNQSRYCRRLTTEKEIENLGWVPSLRWFWTTDR